MLALLAAGFAMVIGCSSGSSDDDTKEPTPNPTENPTDPGDKTPETEPDGVVEIDGEKYYRVTPNEYNTFIEITAVDLSGKTTVKCTVYAKEAKDDVQAVVKLMNAKGQGFALPTLKPITAEPAKTEATILSEADRWDNDTNSNVKEEVTDFKCVKLNPFTQETAGTWPARKDVTIYIGKITAEDDTGNSVVVFDPAKYNGAE